MLVLSENRSFNVEGKSYVVNVLVETTKSGKKSSLTSTITVMGKDGPEADPGAIVASDPDTKAWVLKKLGEAGLA